MKIVIMGYSGSGKSTLAKYLSNLYGIPLLYLDRVYFEAGWKERDTQEAREMVREFMGQDSWVIDGNYRQLYQKERLEQADQIVLMLFNRFAALRRVRRRSREFQGRTRESMADGCTEKLDAAFLWSVLVCGRTPGRRRHYREIARTCAGKTVVLKNQRQLDRFMRAQKNQAGGTC